MNKKKSPKSIFRIWVYQQTADSLVAGSQEYELFLVRIYFQKNFLIFRILFLENFIFRILFFPDDFGSWLAADTLAVSKSLEISVWSIIS
jgi:hypothetical protein